VQQICFAIGNLAFIGDFEQIIISEKGIEHVLEAMRKHEKFPLMMTDAIFFLKNFAFGENGRATIIANGGIPQIVDTMANHTHHHELVELALNLLFDLSFSGAVDIVMQNPNGIQLVLNAMETNQDRPSVMREALRTLYRIYSISNPDQKKMIIKAGATETLRRLLNKNNSQNNLIKQIISAFSLFSREKISHEKSPEIVIPTLTELCARCVVDASVKFCGNLIPWELDCYITEKRKFCSLCGKSYFEFFYEVISWTKFQEFRAPLPVFWKVCSSECFDKSKIK